MAPPVCSEDPALVLEALALSSMGITWPEPSKHRRKPQHVSNCAQLILRSCLPGTADQQKSLPLIGCSHTFSPKSCPQLLPNPPVCTLPELYGTWEVCIHVVVTLG